MPKVALNPEELIGVLKRSSLPVVLVEGKQDAQIYRWIEGRFPNIRLDVLPCGGRENVFHVYRRRHELSHIRVAFLVDSDFYLFTSYPAGYSNVIWTDGYSIENDVYKGSDIENFFSNADRRQFDVQLSEVARWFAREVQLYRQGYSPEVKKHINRIVPPGSTTLSDELRRARGSIPSDAPEVLEILNDYALKLRGKNLIQVVERVLNRRERGTRFNQAAILEICLKTVNSHSPLERILREIRHALE